MRHYWAIATGINQYQLFQPLSYAQRDAKAFHDFLVDGADFPKDQCFLLADLPTTPDSEVIYPNRANLYDCMTHVCQRLKAQDLLWFFFSGYGVRSQGEDYLVPIDGNPAQLPLTAIAVSDLFKLLRQSHVQNVVLALDINRSQPKDGKVVGDHLVKLAHQHNISILLSCQPSQISHETLALRQGFFTAALLEGLRYEKCVTLHALMQYLQVRVPELTEHYWRPVQHPYMAAPVDHRYQFILPEALVTSAGTVGEGSASRSSSSLWEEDPEQFPHQRPSSFSDDLYGTPPSSQSLIPYEERSGAGNSEAANPFDENVEADPEPQSPITDDSAMPDPDSFSPDGFASDESSEDGPDLFWRNVLLGGGLLVTALLLGVILKNWSALTQGDVSQPSTPPVQSVDSNVPIVADPDPLAVPDDSGMTGESSQVILDDAIALLAQPTEATPFAQVSLFRQAIDQASLIPEDDPLYDTAQTYIQRWSSVILDLAAAQAQQDDYVGAIASVQLLPDSQPDLQAEAATLIDQWQPIANSQSILDSARQQIQEGQASSYHDAIVFVRRSITPEQPLYAEAQVFINLWSAEILDLATMRAGSGNLASAIQTAELVPDNTEIFADAQASITTWQNQLDAQSNGTNENDDS